MEYGKSNKPNLNIDDSKSFSQVLKYRDHTITNRLISKIRINVPDLEDYRVSRFDIGESDLETPLICRIQSNNYNLLNRARPISSPEFTPYEYRISQFRDDLPFVENMITRPHGETYFRHQTLTPLSKMPKISVDFDEKINMKKW